MTAPAPDLLTDPDEALAALATMWRIRLFEEAVEDLYGRGMMHGTMHLSIGEEAIPTATCRNLEDGDQITSTHRGHGHCIARGADLGRMMAELLAKDNGYCRGRGGSMHIADVATGNLGANGIVAGGVPIAAGAGLTNQLTGNGKVAVCFHGDGAVGEGAWHEALTLASMWDLPVVFVCENNQYGMSMSSKLAFKVENLSDKAAGYGIPGVTVDGNDLVAVQQATAEAIDRARSGGGPSFVEALTYRWRGHSKSDKNRYRSKEEIAEWKEKDPIAAFAFRILEQGLVTQEQLDGAQTEARTAIREAVVFGTKGEDPDPAAMLDAVYAPSAVDATDTRLQEATR
ncbi:thiamine pyrophosphate-dependent dehydrogenase E1 component subunit alpha [Brachybacterium hainanense]|uniref:Thiamine pyrophosphate-dependent dehydrogenase E1 component subunit alpha n=1 Tax=Brachybacterium hainanense TaxID=1541174 RepID=A0ABV6R635_9MICO